MDLSGLQTVGREAGRLFGGLIGHAGSWRGIGDEQDARVRAGSRRHLYPFWNKLCSEPVRRGDVPVKLHFKRHTMSFASNVVEL